MNQSIRSLIAFAIVVVFLAQIVNALSPAQSVWAGVLQKLDQSYEQKMHDVWGAYFDFMQFVQTTTPDTSVLLFDSKYYFATLNLYFLYPRKLIYGNEETLHSHPEINYVVISDGFPNFPVAGEKIMFDDKQGLYRIYQ